MCMSIWGVSVVGLLPLLAHRRARLARLIRSVLSPSIVVSKGKQTSTPTCLTDHTSSMPVTINLSLSLSVLFSLWLLFICIFFYSITFTHWCMCTHTHAHTYMHSQTHPPTTLLNCGPLHTALGVSSVLHFPFRGVRGATTPRIRLQWTWVCSGECNFTQSTDINRFCWTNDSLSRIISSLSTRNNRNVSSNWLHYRSLWKQPGWIQQKFSSLLVWCLLSPSVGGVGQQTETKAHPESRDTRLYSLDTSPIFPQHFPTTSWNIRISVDNFLPVSSDFPFLWAKFFTLQKNLCSIQCSPLWIYG